MFTTILAPMWIGYLQCHAPGDLTKAINVVPNLYVASSSDTSAILPCILHEILIHNTSFILDSNLSLCPSYNLQGMATCRCMPNTRSCMTTTQTKHTGYLCTGYDAYISQRNLAWCKSMWNFIIWTKTIKCWWSSCSLEVKDQSLQYSHRVKRLETLNMHVLIFWYPILYHYSTAPNSQILWHQDLCRTASMYTCTYMGIEGSQLPYLRHASEYGHWV